MVLNMDISYSPFYEEQNVIEFAKEVLHGEGAKICFTESQAFTPEQRDRLYVDLKGCVLFKFICQQRSVETRR